MLDESVLTQVRDPMSCKHCLLKKYPICWATFTCEAFNDCPEFNMDETMKNETDPSSKKKSLELIETACSSLADFTNSSLAEACAISNTPKAKFSDNAASDVQWFDCGDGDSEVKHRDIVDPLNERTVCSTLKSEDQFETNTTDTGSIWLDCIEYNNQDKTSFEADTVDLVRKVEHPDHATKNTSISGLRDGLYLLTLFLILWIWLSGIETNARLSKIEFYLKRNFDELQRLESIICPINSSDDANLKDMLNRTLSFMNQLHIPPDKASFETGPVARKGFIDAIGQVFYKVPELVDSFVKKTPKVVSYYKSALLIISNGTIKTLSFLFSRIRQLQLMNETVNSDGEYNKSSCTITVSKLDMLPVLRKGALFYLCTNPIHVYSCSVFSANKGSKIPARV